MPQKNIDDIYPLSPMQHLMLTHTLAATDSHVLVNQFRYRIHGELDVKRFHDAWQQLLARHEILRAGFVWEGVQQPVQVIRNKVTVPFEYEDLSVLADAERERALATHYEGERRQLFDLRRAPLMRLTLLRTGADDWLLIWTRHHLILDRWCVDILFEELFACYAQRGAALPPPGRYRDYIAWLKNQDRAAAERYWVSVGRGLRRPQLLFWRAERRDGDARDGQPSLSRRLPAAATAALAAIARSQRTTFAVVIQAALAIALAKLANSSETCFGLTVSGRPPGVRNIERTMGSFINNVPVFFTLDQDVDFGAWLRDLHAAASARQPYEYLSLADVQRASGVPLDTPLFDVLLVLHAPGTETRRSDDLVIEQIASPSDNAFPLSLFIAESHGALQISAVYDTAVVGAALAEACVDLLERVFAVLVEVGDATLATLLAKLEAEPVLRHARTLLTPPSAAQPEIAVPAAADLSDLATRLCEIWRAALGLERIGIDDDFFALGGSSVQAALVFGEMETVIGRSLPLSILFEAGSIRKLLRLLEQPELPSSVLVAIQPRGSRPPLFVVPGVGGNVVSLEALARALGPGQPFFGLQSKGLDGQGQALTRIESIADEFIAAMPDLDGRPFALLGICWGAAAAFEMAHRLDKAGRAPQLLILMDPFFARPAAHTVSSAPTGLGIRVRFVLGRIRLYMAELRRLDGPGRRAWLAGKIALAREKIRHRDPFYGARTELRLNIVTASNLAATRNYQPRPYARRIVVLHTARDAAEEAGGAPIMRDPAVLGSDVEILAAPGHDSGDAISSENAPALARRLAQLLDSV